MEKILYIDAFSGVSGDMFLGALIDAGLDPDIITEGIDRLGIRAELRVGRVQRNGIDAVDISVVSGKDDTVHRDYDSIRRLIESRMDSGFARETALAIFRCLAEAEGVVHGISPDTVHFHEVGAVDSIVDIVGVALGVSVLAPAKIISSVLPLGRGFVETRHGVLPLPAPATSQILSGVPVIDAGIDGELVTPTGAAIIKTLAESFSGIPPMVIEKTGYGAGDRTLPDRPNLLRIILGKAADRSTGDEVEVITTHIDDMNPQFYEHVMSRLFDLGALDVVLTPVIMKKGRPAISLTVIAAAETSQKIVDAVLSETTSIGLRIHRERRVKLDRRMEKVKTELGEIRIKIVCDDRGRYYRASPEYEDVKEAAVRHGISIDGAYRLIIKAVNESLDKPEGRV